MKRITKDMLRGACPGQVELFVKVFPRGAPVTMAALEKAEKAGLDWRWLERFGDATYRAARKQITDSYWSALSQITDSYRAARKPILIAALKRRKE